MKDNPIFSIMNKDICCGCETCIQKCPVGALKMVKNKDGFGYPNLIDSKLCINCKKCIEVCNQVNPNKSIVEESENIGVTNKYYAGYAKNDSYVRNSSSGGIFSAMVEQFLEKYDNAYYTGVVWDNEYKNTVYKITNSIDELDKYRCSKYVQANKNTIYIKVKQHLDDEDNVLFFGCPCEVGGLKKYLNKEYENLFTVDFVCKGPTSPVVWEDYLSLISGNRIVRDINMRVPGDDNWIPQIMKIEYENGDEIRKNFYSTLFGRIFHFYQRKSCYNCMYNDSYRQSDVTIGDFHGAKKDSDYYNKLGTSIVCINTSKGKTLYSLLNTNCYLFDVSLEEISKNNPCMIKPMEKMSEREQFEHDYAIYGLVGAYIRNGFGQ